MKSRWQTRAIIIAAGFAVISTTFVGPRVSAQVNSARPITADDFSKVSPRGFGDRNNSWAQSMLWWQNHLYVGTGRQALCTSFYSIWQFAVINAGQLFADTWLPYPNSDPDLACEPSGADLAIQAEIWRWSPGDNWERVFQSPLDLDNPGGGSPAFPPQPGKKLPYEISIRGLHSFVEPDGTDALYAFGVNSTVMWDRTQLPPPRILRSTDGVDFQPIPQTPGTFLGDLPFNPDHSSFRSPVSFNGRLFVLSGPVFGQGSLIGSADPAKGDDAWFLGSAPGLMFYEIAAFNGWLYLGTLDSGGYAVVKTRAEGPPPYQLIPVVPKGAYLADRPSRSVVSMHEYLGRLYVGTASQTEIIRINPDDTWDLVVGSPRDVPLPGGGSERKYPISGLDAGFGHTLNDHAWEMDDPFRFMYIGTYNASVASKNDPVFGSLLRHNMGAHLYRTPDGWYYSAITTNGFADPTDPLGGRFDYGIRTMATTPHGPFFGTTNDYYGLEIFRAKTHGSNAPDAPVRLEIDATKTGTALLSWQAVARADKYRISRAQILKILVRDDANFEAWNGMNGNKIPDTYVGPYQQIAETTKTTFIDSTVESQKRYMYYVTVVQKDRVSDQGNLVTFPLLRPAETFATLSAYVDRLDQRQRYVNSEIGMTKVRAAITDARRLAVGCKIAEAIKVLNALKPSDDVAEPDASDLAIVRSKLARRLSLFTGFPQNVNSDEFCTQP